MLERDLIAVDPGQTARRDGNPHAFAECDSGRQAVELDRNGIPGDRIDPQERGADVVGDPASRRRQRSPRAMRAREGLADGVGLDVDPVDSPVASVRHPDGGSPIAIPEGDRPTGIVSATEPSASRSRATRSLSDSTTHTLSKPIAISPAGGQLERGVDGPVIWVQARQRFRGERGCPAAAAHNDGDRDQDERKGETTLLTATIALRDRCDGVEAS